MDEDFEVGVAILRKAVEALPEWATEGTGVKELLEWAEAERGLGE